MGKKKKVYCLYIIYHDIEIVLSYHPPPTHTSLYFVQHDKSMFWKIMQIVFYLEVLKVLQYRAPEKILQRKKENMLVLQWRGRIPLGMQCQGFPWGLACESKFSIRNLYNQTTPIPQCVKKQICFLFWSVNITEMIATCCGSVFSCQFAEEETAEINISERLGIL